MQPPSSAWEYQKKGRNWIGSGQRVVSTFEVTPDEAARVMALLTAHKSLVEVGDIEGRVAALEAKQ